MLSETSEADAFVEETFPMMLIGRDHRVSYANTRAHRLFGYEHGGLHGLSIEQLFEPSRSAEVRNVQAVLVGEAPRRWKSVMRESLGGTIEVNVGVEPCFDHRGQVIAVKVDCERVLRSHPPAENEHFDSTTGMRRIAQLAGSTDTRGQAPPAVTVHASMPIASSKSARSTGSAKAPLPIAAAKKPRSSASKPAPVASVKPPPPVESVRPPLPVATVKPPPPVESVRPPPLPPRASNLPSPSRSVASVTPPPVKAVRREPPLTRSTSPKTALQSSPPRAQRPSVSTSLASPTQLVLGEDAVEQMETALQLLGWLRQRAGNLDSLDDPRERARLQYVLTEATELVAQVRCEVRRK